MNKFQRTAMKQKKLWAYEVFYATCKQALGGCRLEDLSGHFTVSLAPVQLNDCIFFFFVHLCVYTVIRRQLINKLLIKLP